MIFVLNGKHVFFVVTDLHGEGIEPRHDRHYIGAVGGRRTHRPLPALLPAPPHRLLGTQAAAIWLLLRLGIPVLHGGHQVAIV